MSENFHISSQTSSSIHVLNDDPAITYSSSPINNSGTAGNSTFYYLYPGIFQNTPNAPIFSSGVVCNEFEELKLTIQKLKNKIDDLEQEIKEIKNPKRIKGNKQRTVSTADRKIRCY